MNPSTQTSPATILVTGASGLSGRILIREFIRQEIPVRASVRNRAKVQEWENHPLVTVFEGDLLRPETYQDALNGVEKALLISSAFERMVETQQSFIEAAKKAGIPHVIKYSGADSGIGFNSQNFIAQKEHENLEDYLIDSGLHWTIIRPAQFMEMYLPGAPTGVNLSDDALILPINQGKLSPVAIADVAKVCVQILTQPGHQGKIYEMTGPDSLNMQEASQIISEVIGRPIVYKNIPLEEYQNRLLQLGASPARLRILREISRERSKCTDSHVNLDTHKRFGIRPTNFAEFIYRNAKAFAR